MQNIECIDGDGDDKGETILTDWARVYILQAERRIVQKALLTKSDTENRLYTRAERMGRLSRKEHIQKDTSMQKCTFVHHEKGPDKPKTCDVLKIGCLRLNQ